MMSPSSINIAVNTNTPTKSKKSLSKKEQEIDGVSRGFDQDLYDLGIIDKQGNHKVNKLWKM